MSRERVFWIIRTEDGNLKGPLKTDAVHRLIREGGLTGAEHIAQHPNGNWKSISQESQFYDTILATMEIAVPIDPNKYKKDIANETIFMPPPPNSDPVPALNLNSQVVPKTADRPAAVTPYQAARAESSAPKMVEDSETGLQRLQRQVFVSTVRWPLVIIIGIALLFFFIFFSESDGPTSDRISLIAVGKPTAPLSEADVKKRFGDILHHIERDTFEDNVEAENKLVSLVEGAPANLEIRSVLCLVYKELWPFAKQDATDQRTVASFTQGTRVLDISSPFGSVCEATLLITNGRYREARGTVENILESEQAFSMQPVVYSLKAELMEGDKDYLIAAPYYEKASQSWDRWAHPRVRLGFLNLAIKDETKAEEWFRTVLTAIPNHKAAQVGLIFAERSAKRSSEQILQQLKQTLNRSGRIPPLLESEAWQMEAEMALDQDDKRTALSAAEKAAHFNPNNQSARQLVMRLGGSDSLAKDKSQNNELVIMGDQYMRQGDCLSAQAEYKAAFELDPKNATAAMKAAKCLWQLNQSYEAIDWLGKAVHSDSKLTSAYVLQSDYQSQRYDFGAAADSLNNAVRVAPGNAEVLRGMALLEFRKNNMIGALNYGQRSMKAYDADPQTYILLSEASLALAQSIQSTDKKDTERRDNSFKDAVRYASKAIEFDATNPESQVAYAKMLSATTGTDAAVEYLQNQIKKYAFSYEYRIALAEVYKDAERWNDVRLVSEQIVDSDVRNKKAWLMLGEAYRSTGFNDKALKAFLSAAVIDPTDGEGLFQAGRLYLESGRYEEALQQFNRVKNMNSHFPRTSYYAGKAAFALGRLDEALKYAKEEKQLNPNVADAYVLLAEVSAARGAFSDCAAEYSRALKLRSSGAEMYVKAATCYRQAGNLEIAGTMLTLALEKESGYPELYRETGALLEKKNESREAVKAYEKYLELAPNAPDHSEIAARVSRLGG